jgi:hypothetical protein
MWAITNRTPYAVERNWRRNKDGVHEWLVAVRGTFDIKPRGRLELADEQPEPLLAPEYNGEPGLSSLRYDADLFGAKPSTDVLLNGTAYAPKGRPSTEFLVSLRLGWLHKSIKVVGQRKWERGVLGNGPSSIEPVTQVPIVYERAYGGFDQADGDPKNQRMDSRNPVGCGLLAKEGQPLPNFEDPHGRLEKAGPAGFGVLDCYWSPRRELHGTYDDAWQQSRFPLVPDDWDPRSLLCSPADQRPATYLEGGEPVELINLTPDGTMRFALPKVRLTFRTFFSTVFGPRAHDHEGRLATVIIEPDEPRVIMVWQSSLVCRANAEYLDRTIVREKLFT